MNTVIDYLYRDGSNYKKANQQVVSGELNELQIEEIWNSCEEREYFIPRQVGLPEERFYPFSEDDHAWFELRMIFPTTMNPTLDLTARELHESFIEASDNWNDTLWMEGEE